MEFHMNSFRFSYCFLVYSGTMYYRDYKNGSTSGIISRLGTSDMIKRKK